MGDDNDLSIIDAVEEAKVELNEDDKGDDGDGDGSKEKSDSGDEADKDKEDGKSDEEADKDKSDDEDSDEDSDDDEDKSGDKSDKDDDSGKDDEYTKERFDGLMSTFNTKLDKMAGDHKVALQGMQDKLDEATKEPEKDKDELPEEMQNADPETKAGFKVIVKTLDKMLEGRDSELLTKVKEAMGAPAKEKQENSDKIQAEVADISAKRGKNFVDNKQDIIKYAVDNNYPMGTLDLAYIAWEKDQKIAKLDTKIKGGKKVNDEVDKDDKKKADIPAGGTDRGKETPKFDEKKDANKSYSDLFKEGLED